MSGKKFKIRFKNITFDAKERPKAIISDNTLSVYKVIAERELGFAEGEELIEFYLRYILCHRDLAGNCGGIELYHPSLELLRNASNYSDEANRAIANKTLSIEEILPFLTNDIMHTYPQRLLIMTDRVDHKGMSCINTLARARPAVWMESGSVKNGNSSRNIVAYTFAKKINVKDFEIKRDY